MPAMRVLLSLLLLSTPAFADVELGMVRVSSGITAERVHEHVERKAFQLEDCLDQQSLVTPGLGGITSVDFTIETTGKVSASNAHGLGTASTLAVGRCIAEVIKTIAFDPPPSSRVTVSFPFLFKSVDETVPTGGAEVDRVMVLRAVRRNRNKVAACHDKQPTLAGTVTAKLTIGADGKVKAASASGVDPTLSTCIANALKGVLFDKPSKQLDVSYPFVFHAPVTTIITGSDDDKMMVRRYIKRNIAKIQVCYEQQLVKQPTLAGTVRVGLIVDAAGKVTHSSGAGVDPEVAKCVAAIVQGIVFDKPSKAPLSINYPFTFRPASP